MKSPVILEHTIDEINTILLALAAKPYAEVAELIHKIKIKAEEQLANASKVNETEPPNE
jgi:hypothetical protein